MTLRNKIIKSKLPDADKADFLELLDLSAQGMGVFKIRSALNAEIVEFIKSDNDFVNDVQRVRKIYKVPRLKPDTDVVIKTAINPQTGDDYNEGVSEWLLLKSDTRKKKFESSINNLLDRYNLPYNFQEWVEYLVLYRTTLPKPPITYYDILYLLLNNPKSILRIGLTTEEKKHIRWLGNEALTRSKVSKTEKRNALAHLDELLAKSKNQRRRLRNLDTAIKAATKPKTISKLVKDTKNGGMKLVKEKRTFEELVADMYPLAVKKVDSRRADLLRKQKQNLLKRMKKPKLKYSKK